MSKNLTRKGLALTAVVALGSSLFAGSPALAAGEQLTVAANSVGKELVAPADNTFALKAYYNPGFSSGNSSAVKFKITTNGSYAVAATTPNGGTAATVTLAQASTSIVVADTTAGSIKSIVLNPASTSAQSMTVTVQAFEDLDGAGTVDTGEWISAPVVVDFIAHEDVVLTPVMDIVRPGATGTASVKVTSNVNLSQLDLGAGLTAGADDTQIVASLREDTTTALTYSLMDAAVIRTTYNSTYNRLDVATTASFDAAVAAGDKIKASFWFGAKAALAAWNTAIINGGSLLTPTAGGPAAQATTTYTVAPVTVATTGGATLTASATVAQAGAAATVIQTAGSFDVSATITASAGASAAGQVVTFTIAESNNDTLVSGASITSGAAVLTNTNVGSVQSKEVTAITNADGKATATFSYAGLTNTDALTNTFTITPTSQGVAGALVTVTAASQTIASITNLNAIGASAQLVVAKDAAFDLSFGVVDTFGKAVTGAGYSVTVALGGTTVVGSVVNGVATVTFPAYTTAGDRTLVAQGKKNGADAGAALNVPVTVGADTVGTSLTYSGSNADHGVTTPIALNVKAAFVAADTRKGEVAALTTANALTTISGNVYTATGAGALTTVTLSGKGLDFVASGVYAKDTITVRTSATGSYSVEVRSSLAGTRTLTLTSGAVVRTQNLIFAQVGSTTGKTLTITGPDSIASGYSLRFAGKLVDALGQPVIAAAGANLTFNVSYDGPGYLGALPTGTDVNGNFFVNVLLGAMDSGIATLTVTYDGDAAGSTLAAISATKTVKIGSAGAVSASAAGIKGFAAVTVRNASGKAVTVTVNGRVLTPRAPNVAAQLFKFRATAGKTTVVVKVDGVTVSSRTVMVK